MAENVFKSAVQSGHGTALVYATMAGLLLSDAVPTPADGVFFWDEQRLKRKLELREITPKQYWVKNALGYYFYNVAWWTLVGIAVIATKGDYSRKAKVGVALIGAGAVFAILHKNIQKDKEIQDLEDEQKQTTIKCAPQAMYTAPVAAPITICNTQNT